MFEMRPYRRNSLSTWNPFSEMEEMERRFALKHLFGLLDFPDSGTEHRTAVPFSQNTYC